ncbi:hypothetical protein P168DRAFT_314178 [Aspergillus campestris IBT 28561]|uniref:Rhodopsin domain-containing protein n=1 Tax=Aspergillus campestris (strain IBT 28561) TaxID=1392248 RepID=A0A2I1DDT3_ASPC2|nr:uncharacterized protein P168DRAFT_314178 [Aspergillus campestris IBT 28561]PKY08049.1 hypothetical protein P168DRAFT_314178 [Aspergillus campestris IBT 28561]
MYVLAVGATFLSLTVLFVSLRIATRIFFIRTLGWDDFFLVFSMLSNVAFFGLTVIQVQNGLGKKESTLNSKTTQKQLKALWITIPLYNLTMNLTKISMGILYLRAFKTKIYQRVLIVFLAFVVISGLWAVLSTLFFCTPIRGFWDKSVHSYCLPQIVIWCVNAALQITTDLLTVILPMPALAKLHLARRQRFALIVIFAIGLFVVATSSIRLWQVIEFIRGPDTTKENSSATSWSYIETSVAIICASLPPLRPLIARLFPLPISEQQAGTSNQGDTQAEKKTTSKPEADPARSFTNTNISYSASQHHQHQHYPSANTTTTITNNINTNTNSEDPVGRHLSSTMPRRPLDGIQVVKHIFWDSDSAHSNDMVPPLEGGRQLQLEPYPGDSLPEPLPRSYQLPEIEP